MDKKDKYISVLEEELRFILRYFLVVTRIRNDERITDEMVDDFMSSLLGENQ